MQTKKVTVKRVGESCRKGDDISSEHQTQRLWLFHICTWLQLLAPLHEPVSPSHMCAKSNGETLLNHFEHSHMRSDSRYCSFKLTRIDTFHSLTTSRSNARPHFPPDFSICRPLSGIWSGGQKVGCVLWDTLGDVWDHHSILTKN